MRKIIISLTLWLAVLSATNADYIQANIEYFQNAPSFADLENIEDENVKYCETTFLEAYMRRPFTQEEINKCRELFSKRIEAEMIYKKYVSWNRGIY